MTHDEKPPFWFELPVSVIATLLTPWVLMKYWQWFIIPLGAAALTYWQAFGLVYSVIFLAQTVKYARYGDGLNNLALTIVALVIGYGAYWNMP